MNSNIKEWQDENYVELVDSFIENNPDLWKEYVNNSIEDGGEVSYGIDIEGLRYVNDPLLTEEFVIDYPDLFWSHVEDCYVNWNEE